MALLTIEQRYLPGYEGSDGFLGENQAPFGGYLDGDKNKAIIIDGAGITYIEWHDHKKAERCWRIEQELVYGDAYELVDKLNKMDSEIFLALVKTLGTDYGYI